MKKTANKLIAMLLSLVFIITACSAAFSVFAEEITETQTTIAAEETTAPEEDDHDPHPTFIGLFITFIREIASFIRYIFYGVWQGEPVPPPVSIPVVG